MTALIVLIVIICILIMCIPGVIMNLLTLIVIGILVNSCINNAATIDKGPATEQYNKEPHKTGIASIIKKEEVEKEIRPYYWLDIELPKEFELDSIAANKINKWKEYQEIVLCAINSPHVRCPNVLENFLMRCNYERYAAKDCAAFEFDIFGRAVGYDIRPVVNSAKKMASINKYGDYYKNNN